MLCQESVQVNPNFVMFFGAVLMFIAAAMMVGQKEWIMLGVTLPIWLAVLGVWVYRRRNS